MDFQYDVFLSHSFNDKTVVRTIAKRLKTDRLKVWFDEWEIMPCLLYTSHVACSISIS